MAWSNYLAANTEAMREVAAKFFPGSGRCRTPNTSVTLVDFDPDGEIKTVAAMLYPYCHEPEEQIEDRVREMGVEDRLSIIKAYVGDRQNRRHKPGRAFERTMYRFDVLSDYGAFRDLQRHRMMTIEWQKLTPYHGYIRPGFGGGRRRGAGVRRHGRPVGGALSRSGEDAFPGAGLLRRVSLAYRVRYMMQFNAREAIHLLELRSGSAGAPELPVGRAGDAHAVVRGRRAPGPGGDDEVHVDHSSPRPTSSVSTPSVVPKPDAERSDLGEFGHEESSTHIDTPLRRIVSMISAAQQLDSG